MNNTIRFSQLVPGRVAEVARKTSLLLAPPPDTDIQTLLTSPEEVAAILKTLPKCKAAGRDNAHYCLRKNLPRKGVAQIYAIYNAII